VCLLSDLCMHFCFDYIIFSMFFDNSDLKNNSLHTLDEDLDTFFRGLVVV